MCPSITIKKKKKKAIHFNFYFPKYKLFVRETQVNIVLLQKLMFDLNLIHVVPVCECI